MNKATTETIVKEIDTMDGLIPFEDDCMFSSVMKRKDACIGLIEALFGGRKVRDIEYLDDSAEPHVQKHMSIYPGSKSIRLDVYFEDSDAVYDVEFQKMDQGDLPKRARLYSSYMDTGTLAKGMAYRDMKNSYVIFICKFDPFGCGDKVYHLETVCRKRPNLQIEDGRYIMFLNTKGTLGESYPDLDALFKYINGGVDSIGNETGSPLVDRLDGYVVELNRSQEWRRERMKYELNLEERYREGRVDGLSQGIEEERMRMVKSFKEQGVPLDVIAKASSLSVDEVRKIQ